MIRPGEPRRGRGWWKLAPVAATAGLALVWSGVSLHRPVKAADHLDPPARTNIGAQSDVASDIADLFIWNTASTVTVVLTGAGPQEPGVAPFYDSNVLYQVHLSNDGNVSTDEATINVRFGKDPSGNWGVQLSGVPGASGPIQGAVQTTLTDSSGAKAIAGLFDDPFFFDLQGFNDTKATGVLSIMNTRNFFAGKNDTAFVVEFPRSAIQNGTQPITAWAETRRIAGS